MEIGDQLHALAALFPGKVPPVSIEYEMGRLQIQSGCCGEEQNIPSSLLPGSEP